MTRRGPGVSRGSRDVEQVMPLPQPGDESLARDTLRAVAQDSAAPAAARAQAARTLLELAGRLGPQAERGTSDRPVSDLSRAEIEAELASLRTATVAVGS